MGFKWGMRGRLCGKGWALGRGGVPRSSPQEMRDDLVGSKSLLCFKKKEGKKESIDIKERREKRKRAHEGCAWWGMDRPRIRWSIWAPGAAYGPLLIPGTEGQRLVSRARGKPVTEGILPRDRSGLDPNCTGPGFSGHSSREAFCVQALPLPPSPSPWVSHFPSPVQSL